MASGAWRTARPCTATRHHIRIHPYYKITLTCRARTLANERPFRPEEPAPRASPSPNLSAVESVEALTGLGSPRDTMTSAKLLDWGPWPSRAPAGATDNVVTTTALSGFTCQARRRRFRSAGQGREDPQARQSARRRGTPSPDRAPTRTGQDNVDAYATLPWAETRRATRRQGCVALAVEPTSWLYAELHVCTRLGQTVRFAAACSVFLDVFHVSTRGGFRQDVKTAHDSGTM